MPDLNQVLRDLHDSEIIAGIQTLSDGGVRVWLGDENAPASATSEIASRIQPAPTRLGIRLRELTG